MRRPLDAIRLLLPALVVVLGPRPAAGQPPDVQTSRWNDHEQLTFKVGGRSALLVVPATPAPGKPWIWRTEFFGIDPQADVALLGKGFHVAYVDVGGMFGAPAALDAMDGFYDHVVKHHGLAAKTVLEGFSRGGLYAMNWAARHPDRVACIYLDAPVCDFKSWPGGGGRSRFAGREWRQLLQAYGMSDEQARAWPLNPVDNLEPLAAAKIPILCVIGDVHDWIVPIEENALKVEERYRKLGGEIEVIRKPKAGHRPHSLPDPTPIVDFVVRHAGGAAPPAPADATKARPLPNILILYADDLGFGDLGANNPASKIPTPHLDRLAAGGMRFTDGHSSSAICTPSRYALLTGRHHWRDFHDIAGPYDETVFKPGQLTLPALLRQRGYTTACMGKWHLGFGWKAIRRPGTSPTSIEHADFDWTGRFPGGPLDHGFDHYFGDNVINFPPYCWIEDDRFVEPPDTTLRRAPGQPPEGGWEVRPGPARSGWDFYQVLPTLTRRGVDYIRSRKGLEQPFFLYFPLPSPHAPIVPTAEFVGRSQAGPFGDFVVQTDDACGQLLKALREAGLEENTIVILSADNGAEHFAYPRDARFDHWSSAPFRGLKRDLYEGGHHVPFLIRWPGVTKPGAVSDALISQVDLMATLASAVGFDLPAEAAVDSHDFLPWLRGEADRSPRTTIVHNTSPGRYAIRHGDWLLVDAENGTVNEPPPAAWLAKHGVPPDDGLPVELFDLRRDVGQRENVAAAHPDTVAELQSLLKSIREGRHTAPRLD